MNGHRAVSILRTCTRNAHFLKKIPVQYFQQLKRNRVFPCAVVGFKDFVHLRKFLKVASGGVVKPLDVRKSSNLSRIIPLEEPLNGSEPKRIQPTDCYSVEGLCLPPIVR
jgi:uncharacterized protein YjhX (UPF0386 family)